MKLSEWSSSMLNKQRIAIENSNANLHKYLTEINKKNLIQKGFSHLYTCISKLYETKVKL